MLRVLFVVFYLSDHHIVKLLFQDLFLIELAFLFPHLLVEGLLEGSLRLFVFLLYQQLIVLKLHLVVLVNLCPFVCVGQVISDGSSVGFWRILARLSGKQIFQVGGVLNLLGAVVIVEVLGDP